MRLVDREQLFPFAVVEDEIDFPVSFVASQVVSVPAFVLDAFGFSLDAPVHLPEQLLLGVLQHVGGLFEKTTTLFLFFFGIGFRH